MSCDVSFVLTSPDRPVQNIKIDWKLCFICQKKEPKSVQTVSPSNRKDFDKKDSSTYGSYITVAKNLVQWKDENNFPVPVKQRINLISSNLSPDEVTLDLQKSFVSNEAIFHKTCICKYDITKLERKRSLPNTDY